MLVICHCTLITEKLTLNSKHLLSHRFCGLGIWVWLSWVLWLKTSARLQSLC